MNPIKILRSKAAVLMLAVVLAAALVAIYLATGPQQTSSTSTHVPETQSPAATGASPATEAPTSVTATTTPEAPRLQLQAQPQRSEVRRVILISIDAARAMDVWPLARDGFLKNMGKIAAEGAYGELSPIFPAETVPNHAAFLTGAPSGIHGAFSDVAYPKSPFEGGKSEPGYWGRLIAADTIWEAALRKGYRVAISNFIHGYVPTWQARLSDADKNKIVIIYTTKAYTPGVGFAGSQLYSTSGIGTRINYTGGKLYIPIADTVLVGEVQSTGGGARVLVLYQGNKKIAEVPEGGWASVVVNVTEKGTTYLAAFMVKALSLAPNDVRIYRGNALVYNAPIPWFMGPEDLKRKYWEEVVEKGYIDVYHGLTSDVGRGWIDLKTYAEIVNYTVDYYWRTNLFVLKNVEFQLMTGYDVTPDPVEHAILGLMDPSMPYSNASIAEWARRTYLGMWARIDQWIGEFMKEMNNGDVLIVVGDHGQWGVRGCVAINTALRRAGLLVTDEKGNPDFSRSVAYYDGGYIYINPKYKADPATYSRVVERVMEVLLSIRDPATGEWPFALVVARTGQAAGPLATIYGHDFSSLFLDGPAKLQSRIGDIAIAVKPGYCAYDKSATRDNVVNTPIPFVYSVTGCHDGLGSWKELRSIIGIWGKGVEVRQLKGFEAYSPQVGSTIAALLGLELRNATFAPIWVLN
ncbi:hypothetical protein B7L68_02720 [Thermoproteus sp. CP80]|uniref:alkaline phosphatase family protein n=1 Tax=Thermoproteus sp. CP80 TaxID=1650659 RepID=UPI0009BE4C32|nr:alkaline phosphatase family protein [Thermoproteus sp. CP80]PLC65834.1 hypothetical protein B7L68_02720 [Thermoproteus sp. CP80]